MFDAHIQGIAGGNAETKTFNSGNSLTRVDIAINQGYYSKEKREWVKSDPETVWVTVQAFRDAQQYAVSQIHKGDSVDVTGSFEAYNYMSRNGEPRTGYRLTVDTVAIVPRKPRNNQPSTPQFSSGAPLQNTPATVGGVDPWSASSDPWGDDGGVSF